MKTKIFSIVGLLGMALVTQAADWVVRQVQVPGGVISYSVSGTTCTMTAEPSANYKFVQWLDDETAPQTRVIDFSDQTTSSAAMVYRAAFAYVPATELTEGPVDVEVADEAIPSYSLTVNPSSPANHPFSHWTNGLRTSTITYTEPEGLVVPRFAGISVNAQLAPGGKVNYQYVGNLYTLTAVPNPDYEFQQWTDGETTNPRVVSASDIVGDGSVAYHAVFVHQPSVHFNRGDVTVTLTQASPIQFNLSLSQCDYETYACWSNASTALSTPYVEADGNVVPHFLKALPENTSAYGGHIDFEEIKCGYRLTAVADNGYSFSKWENNSTSAVREVDLSEADYQAYFVSAAYQVGDQFFGDLADAISLTDNEHPIIVWLDKGDNAIINKNVIINGGGHQIGDLTIQNGAQLQLTSSLQVNDLYLNATTGSSSQLKQEQYLAYNHAYVDITLEAGEDVASPDKWYAFAVPFEVSIPEGIHRKSNPDAPTLVSGEDFLIWEYDGQMRADNMDNGWKQMPSGTLRPGNFYMIGIGGTENTWRFTKKTNGTLTSTNAIDLYEFPSSNYRHAGWNAVGNSSLVYADASTTNGVTIAQVYENGAETANYQVKHLGEASFVMACPFFIQTAGDDELNLSDATHLSNLYAPARQQSGDYFKIQLLQDAAEKDVIFLTVNDNAKDEYVIGKDVAKLMGGNTNTYLYTNAYGMKLCAEDAKLDNGIARFYLGISTPQAGRYVLNLAKSADATVYVTLNDMVIWNLSQAPYTFDLEKGTTSNYGLLVYARAGVPTSIQEGINQSSNVQKFINDGILYINVNGSVYNAQGSLIER
jgi:hypothetical protein